MHKHLQLNVGYRLVYLSNLVDRQFAGKHHPRESQALQPLHLVGSAVVGLGAGMTFHGKTGKHVEQCHILDENGINSDVGKLMQETTCSIKFIVINDCVDSDIHLSTESVGIATQLGYIVERVAGSCTRTESLGTDIYGI